MATAPTHHVITINLQLDDTHDTHAAHAVLVLEQAGVRTDAASLAEQLAGANRAADLNRALIAELKERRDALEAENERLRSQLADAQAPESARISARRS